jgi:hypothetical protein
MGNKHQGQPSTVLPVKWTAAQVHHSFEINEIITKL